MYCVQVQVYPYTSTKENYASTIIVRVYTNMCRLVGKQMGNAQYTNDHVAGFKTVDTVDVLVLLHTCICYTVVDPKLIDQTCMRTNVEIRLWE